MKNVEVSIVYVNYNSVAPLKQSVDSVIKKTNDINYEIIIVDNNSSDDFASLNEINIKIIKNKKNYGFAKACNIGAKNSNGEFILFLNPDTILKQNCIKILKDFLNKRDDVGAAGCLTIEGDRENALGGARTFHTIFTEILERFNFSKRFFKNPYYFSWNFETTRAVDALIGSCIMIKRKIFEKINGFDERFFLYYEDVDLCKRIWEIGYKVYFLSDCRIFHKGGESTEKSFENEEKIFYINLDSAYLYFKKHFGSFYAKIWWKLISLLYFLKYMLKKDFLSLKLSKWRPKFE